MLLLPVPIYHGLMAFISFADDQTVQSIFSILTVAYTFVFLIESPKFVRNLKLHAITGKPNA